MNLVSLKFKPADQLICKNAILYKMNNKNKQVDTRDTFGKLKGSLGHAFRLIC